MQRALRRVKKYAFSRSEVISGPGDDAALVEPPCTLASGIEQLLVHSIDYFKSFISDPYLFGQIAANHALSGYLGFIVDKFYFIFALLCLRYFCNERRARECIGTMHNPIWT